MIQVLRTTERRVEQEYFKRMPLCQVNGFIREYIVSQSMEDNLVFALDGHCRKNLQRTGRHLAIERSCDRDPNVYESIDFTRLRSLTVFSPWEPFFVSDKMRLLRMLDLEDVSSGQGNLSSPRFIGWPEAASDSGYQRHLRYHAATKHHQARQASVPSSWSHQA